MTTATSKASSAPPITDTGVKGFLMWFAREQPAIYAKIAPQLPNIVPKAFSNYNAKYKKRLGSMTQKKVNKILRARPMSSKAALSDLSDYYESYYAQMADAYTTDSVSIPSVDAGSIDVGSFDDTISTGLDVPTYSPVATAANSGTASTGILAAIGQTIGAASTVLMGQNNAALQQQALQTNLQRAAAGLPPLNTSLNALGIPTVSSTGSLGDTGMILLLGGAVALVALLGGSKKSQTK